VSREGEETTAVVPVDATQGAAQVAAPTRDRCSVTVLAGPATGVLAAMKGDTLVIGRGTECDLSVDDTGLSRRHVQLSRRKGEVVIEDLGSRNGTLVDGELLSGPRVVHDGARVKIGRDTVLRVGLHDALEEEAQRKLYDSAVRDSLTRLYNRRYLDERLHAEVAYAIRHRASLSVILIDLDHFKRVNDTLGHLAGDAVLRLTAAMLVRMVRTEDLVARWGGEEFMVLARGAGLRNAHIFADRMRRAIEQMEIPWQGATHHITVSMGVASVEGTPARMDPAALIAAADAALYEAKHAGRNRVVSSGG
jgi:diguanylate cyclase (GGDEF)-like protein